VLGGDRRDVRMVMLHRVQRHAPPRRELARVPGAEEVGMQIVRDHRRLDVEDRDEVREGLLQRGAGRRIIQVADVLRDERLVAARDADRALEVAPTAATEGPARSRRMASGVYPRARRRNCGPAVRAPTLAAAAAALTARTTLSSQRITMSRS